MYGKGLIKGLAVTGKASVSKRLTEKYPEVKPVLPKCWRGDFQMDVDKCIACGLCARACPNHAITCEIGKTEEGKKKMMKYEINRSYCLHCGLCVETCPTHCLKFTLEFETAIYHKENVVHDLLKNPNMDAVASTFGQPVKMPVAPAAEKKEEKEVVNAAPVEKQNLPEEKMAAEKQATEPENRGEETKA